MDEEVITSSLCKLHYLKGVISGLSSNLSFNDYMDCMKSCNSLISLLQNMLEDKEGVSKCIMQ